MPVAVGMSLWQISLMFIQFGVERKFNGVVRFISNPRGLQNVVPYECDWQFLTPSLYSLELILSSFYPPFMFHTSLRNPTELDENRSGLLVTNRSLWSVVSLAMDYWLLDVLPQDKVKPASHTEHNMCLCTWQDAWNNNLKKMTKNDIICIDKYLTNLKVNIASMDIYIHWTKL